MATGLEPQIIERAAEQITHEVSGIAALGLDWKLFISQVVNFVILFILLRLFAYKPILRILEQRRKTIEKSLEAAKLIEKREHELDEQVGRRLQQAKEKAEQIIDQAKQTTESMRLQVLNEINQDRGLAKKRLDEEMKSLKEQTIEEAKKELASLVTAASMRVLGKIADQSLNEKIVRQTLKEI